ncbi:MAG: serine protease, partial [Gammaproteobacteria bacterium]|nr:serine protease [Gammaproteobacteria bacterium]
MKGAIGYLARLHAAVALGLALGCAQPHAAELPVVIAQVKPAIVGIGTVFKTRRPPVIMRATGFVVADGLHAITNAHSLPEEIDTKGGEVLAVLITDGTARPATVVEQDLVHDLALLAFK